MPKKHSCGECGKTFDSPAAVIRHRRTHTGERPFQCELCGCNFNQKANLNSHIELIHDKKRIHSHECEDCGWTFDSKSHLQRHRRTHTGERPFECEVCGAAFSQKSNLQTHERIHTGEKPFACEKCNFKCERKSRLQQHDEAIHGAQQLTHECDECGKKFKTSNTLSNHKIYTHTSYACELCEYTTTRKDCLTSHIAHRHSAVHSTVKPFKCGHDGCNKAYKTSNGLQYHSLNVHGLERINEEDW